VADQINGRDVKMGKHLSYNKKMKLTRLVLDGAGYASAGKEMGVPPSTAQDITKSHVLKYFFPSEIDDNGLTSSDINACRSLWRRIYHGKIR